MFRDFIDRLVSWVPSTFRTFVKLATLFVATLCVIWVVLFSLHFIIPTSVLADPLPKLAFLKEAMFANADAALGRNEYDTQTQAPAQAQFIYDTTYGWSETCLEPDQSAEWARLRRLQNSTSVVARQIAITISEASTSLDTMRNTAVRFASLLILLGMATTIVSALNSSEFGSGSGKWAATIKITAIVLPALSTAITAYAALYSPPDLATRKAQLVSNLSSLGSDIAVAIADVPCPIRDQKDLVAIEKQLASWQKRLSEVVSNSIIPQPSSGSGQTPTSETVQDLKDHSNGDEKPEASKDFKPATSTATEPSE